MPRISSGSWRSPIVGDRKSAAMSGSSMPRLTSRSVSTFRASGAILRLESFSAAASTLDLGEFSGLDVHRIVRKRKDDFMGEIGNKVRVCNSVSALFVGARFIDH